MAESLWTKKAPPPQWIILQLCRDVYHCLPSELEKEDAAVVYTHILMLQVESQVESAKRK